MGRLVFSDSCVNTIKEFASYIWDEKAAQRGEDKPIKEHDHCLTGDTLVDTPGGQIPIRELVGKKGKVYCYDQKRHRKKISKFYNVRLTQRNATVYEIQLVDGGVFKCTGNHLILTERGWIQAKDLKPTDAMMKV